MSYLLLLTVVLTDVDKASHELIRSGLLDHFSKPNEINIDITYTSSPSHAQAYLLNTVTINGSSFHLKIPNVCQFNILYLYHMPSSSHGHQNQICIIVM